MAKVKSNLEFFLTEYAGHLTNRQVSAIRNGLELTTALEETAQQALGLRKDLVETKRNTIIWSPPGVGKTFTVRNVADKAKLDYVKYHGKSTLNGFVMKMAKACYLFGNKKTIPVWIDDCDSFFSDKQSLDFMKIVLDNDEPMVSWNVNMGSQISKAEKEGDDDLASALKHFDNGGVGIEIPLNNCRFVITTNKKLAGKQDLAKKKTAIDEHAIRDRVNWRAFDITAEEAWGWMSSVMLSSNVFVDDGFTLTPFQMHLLLSTFYNHWDQLNANSMRTVKEAGAMLYNNPKTFATQFQQHFL
jgi:hypothetical protein